MAAVRDGLPVDTTMGFTPTGGFYILPFDHRGSFQSGLFGWKGALTADQTARATASKAIICFIGFAVGRTTF